MLAFILTFLCTIEQYAHAIEPSFSDEIAKFEKKWQIERRDKILQRLVHETANYSTTDISRQERKREIESKLDHIQSMEKREFFRLLKTKRFREISKPEREREIELQLKRVENITNRLLDNYFLTKELTKTNQKLTVVNTESYGHITGTVTGPYGMAGLENIRVWACQQNGPGW